MGIIFDSVLQFQSIIFLIAHLNNQVELLVKQVPEIIL